MTEKTIAARATLDYVAHLKQKMTQEEIDAALTAKMEADQKEIERLQGELEALGRELLTPRVFSRLLEWLRDPVPAQAAFTAGIERQIAYALEMDLLPEVKQLRAQRRLWLDKDLTARALVEQEAELIGLRAELEALRRGEFICGRCGLRKDGELDGPPNF